MLKVILEEYEIVLQLTESAPLYHQEEITWWSSGWDSALSLQGAQVISLVGELGSCMLCSVAKINK